MAKIKRRTPARIIWDIIAAEMQRQGVTQVMLAKRAHVDKSTVGSDGRNPEKIPMFRVWLYFAILGIDPDIVLRPLAVEHAEHMIRKEG